LGLATFWAIFSQTHLVTLVECGAGLTQGCQIFLGTTYQNGKTCTKWPMNISKGNKIDGCKVNQMALKYTKV
jgi:hypothetical protein